MIRRLEDVDIGVGCIFRVWVFFRGTYYVAVTWGDFGIIVVFVDVSVFSEIGFRVLDYFYFIRYFRML